MSRKELRTASWRWRHWTNAGGSREGYSRLILLVDEKDIAIWNVSSKIPSLLVHQTLAVTEFHNKGKKRGVWWMRHWVWKHRKGMETWNNSLSHMGGSMLRILLWILLDTYSKWLQSGGREFWENMPYQKQRERGESLDCLSKIKSVCMSLRLLNSQWFSLYGFRKTQEWKMESLSGLQVWLNFG